MLAPYACARVASLRSLRFGLAARMQPSPALPSLARIRPESAPVLQAHIARRYFRKLVRLRDPHFGSHRWRAPAYSQEPQMDLNYLYHRRGVATYLARHAACGKAREVHRAFARAYSGRIDRMKSDLRDDAA